MYQSIPAVNTPPGDPRGFAHPFCRAPRDLPTNLCPGGGGAGFRRGQIFPEMNENLLNIFIFRGCFQKAIQNGRKNSRFCLRKLHLSPRISLLNQLKRVTILFLKQMLPKSMFKIPFRIKKSSNI